MIRPNQISVIETTSAEDHHDRGERVFTGELRLVRAIRVDGGGYDEAHGALIKESLRNSITFALYGDLAVVLPVLERQLVTSANFMPLPDVVANALGVLREHVDAISGK